MKTTKIETVEIRYFELVMSTYHGTPVGRVRFENDGKVEESALFTPSELTNLIACWKSGELLGSFGIGTKLADDANFILCEV